MKVTLDDCVESFGTNINEFTDDFLDLFNKTPLEYDIPNQEDIILEVLKRLENDNQIIGSKERTEIWENGWRENLELFKQSKDMNDLTPKFIRPKQAIRFMGKYILSKVDNFELNYYSLFRLWFFQRYFLGYDYIYDFGCGSGFNLAMLAQMYPNTQLVGLDFVPSSVELAREIGNILDIYIDSYMFDLIQPNYSITIKKNSLVFTSGVIEQVASKFNEFLDYIIYNKPKLCIHIEPTIEMYENNLFDYLAIMFHKKRGYTVGYLPALQELEKQGKAEIIKVKRLYFGSLMMEGFTYIIWRPL